MLRLIAKIFAKLKYRFHQEVEAASNDLSASLAARTADEHRMKAAVLKTEADTMDARIKEVNEMEEKGYWECENGHEFPCDDQGVAKIDINEKGCAQCSTPLKFIKRDRMTGQEKYESDKECNEAQKMAADRRTQAKAEEDAAIESDRAVKYFRGLAQSNRSVAEKIRAL